MRKNGDHSKKNSAPVPDEPKFILRLFITGATPNSIRAVANIKDICERHLQNKYVLEIIDVYQQLSVAEQEQLIALPLLIKKSPGPEKRLIGDLSDTEKVLKGLGIFQDSGRGKES